MKITAVAATVLGLAASTLATPPRLGGVNTAGYDFSVSTDGYDTLPYAQPPLYQYPYFSLEGANLYRIPFAWQLATPTLGGALNTTWLAEYDQNVQAALATYAFVIVDVHNYARWNGEIINQGGPTIEQFASMWSQMAAYYKSDERVIFGIMNEPHDLPDDTLWPPAVQGAINAIRAAGANTQYILMPGSNYTSAAAMPTVMGPLLLNITDPATPGSTEYLLFDVHQYLDYDNSGTHSACVTNNTEILSTLVTWLKANGGRQAILSETGGGRNDSTCYTNLGEELAFVKDNYPYMVGFSTWAAGAFDTTYILSLTPTNETVDAPLWEYAVRPNLPAPTYT
ncbi:glycoside hydrolase family 5 protein [Calocera viscosa TUFC12733]|uniref:cellulase n=1 Tax=Calocera viscosa (strain TUFC12733) TaxID=1330018 RepID=A0A167J6Q2_CALVF|nr:glycoside hydrolase family 5 protein [Calocera viscosa TUFC12733]